ncbi:MAG TPA: biotin/lipoyl-containing protein [Anaerolineales bacterium]|nr:biotin/lipoyl-containing protein [Anaerolineales bacterium]
MKFTFEGNSQTIPVDLMPGGSDWSYRARIGEKTVDVEILQAKDGKLDLLIDGKRTTAYVSSDNAKRWITVNGQTFVLIKSLGAKQRGAGHDHASELAAPMPGQVRAVNVSEEESVKKGQTLLVLEAMKMEIRIQAPRDGKVKKLLVKQGQTVEREQVLIEIEEN